MVYVCVSFFVGFFIFIFNETSYHNVCWQSDIIVFVWVKELPWSVDVTDTLITSSFNDTSWEFSAC